MAYTHVRATIPEGNTTAIHIFPSGQCISSASAGEQAEGRKKT